MADEQDTVVPILPGPAPQIEAIAASSSEVLSTLHDNTLRNFRLDHAPQPSFPSLYQLAKHVVGQRGILRLYRYPKEE